LIGFRPATLTTYIINCTINSSVSITAITIIIYFCITTTFTGTILNCRTTAITITVNYRRSTTFTGTILNCRTTAITITVNYR
jgi:hypothetical protein